MRLLYDGTRSGGIFARRQLVELFNELLHGHRADQDDAVRVLRHFLRPVGLFLVDDQDRGHVQLADSASRSTRLYVSTPSLPDVPASTISAWYGVCWYRFTACSASIVSSTR